MNETCWNQLNKKRRRKVRREREYVEEKEYVEDKTKGQVEERGREEKLASVRLRRSSLDHRSIATFLPSPPNHYNHYEPLSNEWIPVIITFIAS